MRAAVLVLLLFGCRGPDRWSVTTGHARGDADSPKVSFNTESDWMEVGISGPIGSPPEKPRAQLELPPAPEWKPATAPALPQDGGVPWEEILLLAGGALGLEGSK